MTTAVAMAVMAIVVDVTAVIVQGVTVTVTMTDCDGLSKLLITMTIAKEITNLTTYIFVKNLKVS